MPTLGTTELIIVLVIVVVLFGGAKLPKLARSLREAKDEFEGGKDDATTKADAKADAKRSAKKGAKDDPDDKVTLSRSELDALLTERELKAKQD